MKKIAGYLLLALTVALSGSAVYYYPSLKSAVARLLIEENREQRTKHEEHEESEDHSGEAIVKLSDDQMKRLNLDIQAVAAETMTLTLSSRGKIVLDPNRLAHIVPKVPGIATVALKNIGNTVKAGEVIAMLDSQEMADLKAAYLAAISKEKLSAALFQREKTLFQKGIASGQDYLNSQNAWEEARISLQLDEQKLNAFGLDHASIAMLAEQDEPNLREYEIYAPIDGTVLMRHLTTGEFVDHNVLIYEIADLSSVWVETAIYPKDLNRVHEGQEIEVVNLEDLSSAAATLFYLSPTIEGETIAAKALALLENRSGKWRPGQFVTVTISTAQVSAPIAISKEAIQKIDGCDCAFVQTEKGYEKRDLKLGRSDHQFIEVLAGLMPGEKYVSRNSFLLKAEMKKNSAKDED